MARLEGLCPFHDERSPSFGINPVEKVYYCFGCGAGGDVFKFVMETENLNFGQALESLAERYRVTLEREAEDPQDAEKRAAARAAARAAGAHRRLLRARAVGVAARRRTRARTSSERGLEESALRAYRVGFAPDTWDRVVIGSRRAGYTENELVAAGLATRSQRGSIFDRFRGRITFPLADERGRVLGFGARAMKPDDKPKYLNTSESDLFHKGRIVYGADLARAAAAQAGRVVLVEGYTDVIALHQAGVPEVVAQMGTALTEQQVDAIARLAPKALFCQDPDRAGQESVAKGIAALRSAQQGPLDARRSSSGSCACRRARTRRTSSQTLRRRGAARDAREGRGDRALRGRARVGAAGRDDRRDARRRRADHQHAGGDDPAGRAGRAGRGPVRA